MTSSDFRRYTLANAAIVAKYASFFKAIERNSPYQTRITLKIPRSSSVDNFKSHSSSLKAKIRFKQKYEVQYTENMPRS